VDQVIETLSGVATDKGVMLRAEGLEELPTIYADETRLYNAFYNLINNAIPEVPRGGSVTVRGRVEPGTETVLISVADTGRGMPEEVRRSLFAARTISRKQGGTGLGTKIVKDVVEAHGGQISVESQENVGSTFHLRLPFHPAAGRSGTGEIQE
jgi:signal transduction histidine kinase